MQRFEKHRPPESWRDQVHFNMDAHLRFFIDNKLFEWSALNHTLDLFQAMRYAQEVRAFRNAMAKAERDDVGFLPSLTATTVRQSTTPVLVTQWAIFFVIRHRMLQGPFTSKEQAEAFSVYALRERLEGAQQHVLIGETPSTVAHVKSPRGRARKHVEKDTFIKMKVTGLPVRPEQLQQNLKSFNALLEKLQEPTCGDIFRLGEEANGIARPRAYDRHGAVTKEQFMVVGKAGQWRPAAGSSQNCNRLVRPVAGERAVADEVDQPPVKIMRTAVIGLHRERGYGPPKRENYFPATRE